MENTNETDLLNKFNNLYKGCTLFAIHLDGFSHEVFYKDQNGTKHIDERKENGEFINVLHWCI